ncbi:Nif3-like dinuclear metal center hexameric protein [Virgibacillus dakarensis]|uniref:GTP cyclohydrolase 1 type 2 homolog n=1 Tax=Lentibacillus populi TaxID=1827502 RepID=A0A9W5X3R3_9BACI|nr:Nif3-like dinuclear metal center hexameric protein [Lentibacillus populi]MTW84090.1 Nif3-like dinuclear metal center hexameric protein [Virgibacillus dakarensis]GGB29160.1 GTP cyclohydrolase 1 type 2 [Lentibacillus populi]
MSNTVQNADVFSAMEQWAPKWLAYDWDNVGLQVGAFNRPVKKVMITLDVLESVVDEAIDKQVNLIVAHHPLLFKPVKQLNLDSVQGRIVQKLIQHHISVYAAHTNLDAATGGVNDILCDTIGINQQDVLLESHTEKLVKFSVFVPRTHTEDIMDALSEAGAGHIGNYSHCTFQTEGRGTFKPLEGTNPYIGSENELAMVEEVKIETIVPEERITNVVKTVTDRHPYEEVAYDIYPLENKAKMYGIGRIGTLKQGMSLNELCEHVKTALDISHVRVTGDVTKQIKKIAILGGSGEKYIHVAKAKGADAYITGDMTFHTAQDAWQMGLAVIDPGHHVEKVMKKKVQQYLEQRFDKQDIQIIISEANTEPFRFI